MLFNIESTIKTAGYIGLFSIVFAETGLFFGFILPGDSLLFTAGIVASQGYLNIAITCLVLFIAAVLGDSTGYAIGNKFGKRLFHRQDSLFFHKDHLEKAHKFYDKYGGKTIILARFMPIIRTFAPTVAGIADMPYTTFLFFNVIGGFLWSVGLTLSGYFLGRLIPDVDKYLLPIIGIIVLISIAPAVKEILGTKEKRDAFFKTLTSYKRK
jgi:membrane-associated protein